MFLLPISRSRAVSLSLFSSPPSSAFFSPPSRARARVEKRTSRERKRERELHLFPGCSSLSLSFSLAIEKGLKRRKKERDSAVLCIRILIPKSGSASRRYTYVVRRRRRRRERDMPRALLSRLPGVGRNGPSPRAPTPWSFFSFSLLSLSPSTLHCCCCAWYCSTIPLLVFLEEGAESVSLRERFLFRGGCAHVRGVLHKGRYIYTYTCAVYIEMYVPLLYAYNTFVCRNNCSAGCKRGGILRV